MNDFTTNSSCDQPRSRLARRLSIASMFSIDPRRADRGAHLRRAAASAAAALYDAMRNRSVTTVTGPSGAGKSTVLRELTRTLRSDGQIVTLVKLEHLVTERRVVIDLFRHSLVDDIRLLCSCGLAEASTWLRPVRQLSEGERWRVAFALAMQRACRSDTRGSVLVADEFVSLLDRVSAETLCTNVRRLIGSRPGVRLVVASAHDDVPEWLDADVTMTILSSFTHDGSYELRTREDVV